MSVVLTDALLGETDAKRLRNNRARVLEALRAAGSAGLLNWQLVPYGGMDAPRRVRELKEQGFDIAVEQVAAGAWRYTLRADAVVDTWTPPGTPAASVTREVPPQERLF